jgi:hypothetical protein
LYKEGQHKKIEVYEESKYQTYNHTLCAFLLRSFAKAACSRSTTRWRLPGGNTAEGQSALLSLTTGGFNTAVGLFSLLSNTDGSFN